MDNITLKQLEKQKEIFNAVEHYFKKYNVTCNEDIFQNEIIDLNATTFISWLYEIYSKQ